MKKTSYSSTKLWAKRDRKRKEAEARQVKHDGLTVEQKLEKVAKRNRLNGGHSQNEVAKLFLALYDRPDTDKAYFNTIEAKFAKLSGLK